MNKYIREGKYTIEAVRDMLGDKLFSLEKKPDIEFHGKKIKANSQRYQTFFTKGCQCVRCGMVAHYFVLERDAKNSNQPNRYHFNLYGIDQDGNEILFTKDHIIPRSRGGKNRVENYQTMCCICNVAKGSKLEEEME